MTDNKYVVGVDVGTGSARAGVFDAKTGTRQGVAVFPIRMNKPLPHYAEQSSDNIWQAVGECVRTAVAQAGIDPATVVGIGFDATCSLVVLDARDAPVTVSPTKQDDWNVIVWMDHRAVADADAINAGGYDVLRFVGGAMSPEMEPPKLRWLRREMPDSWSRAAKFFDLADFLTYRATGGRDIRSLCTNVCKWAFRGQESRWDNDFYDAIGIGEILDGNRVPRADAIRPVGERIGPLSPEAAAHFGLTTDCAVAVGIIDAHAGGLGLLGMALSGQNHDTGSTENLAALETVVALIGGTSNCHMAAAREPVFVPGVWGPYFGAMVPGTWLTEGGQSAAGSLIDGVIMSGGPWGNAVIAEADAQGVTVYELLNHIVERLAAERGFANPAFLMRNLHVLDFHLGNRSPHADPHARGVVEGMGLETGIDQAALWYLATIQAVAYGTRAIIEAMNAAPGGFRINTILATGGGTKNPLWLQQHADATGMTLQVGAESESVLLGAAILGAAASGVYPSVSEAMCALSRPGATVSPDPDPAVRAFHAAKYAVYQDLYAAQKRHRETMAGGSEG